MPSTTEPAKLTPLPVASLASPDHNNNTETTAACVNDTLQAFKHIAAAFPKITMHLHVGVAGRPPTYMGAALVTLDLLGHPPNIVLAPHLSVMGPADEALLKHHPVGALFLAGAEADEWNAGQQLLNVPLASLNSSVLAAMGDKISTSFAANSAKAVAPPWLVVDAAMPAHALEAAEDAEYAEVSAIESMLASARGR